MTALELELRRAVRALRGPHYNRLRAAGVSWSAMESAAIANPFALGVARAEIDGEHWVPSETGKPVFVTGIDAVVWTPEGFGWAWIDAIAWTPGEPMRWYSRTGLGVILGTDHLDRARYPIMGEADPLILHQSALDWLHAGGDGAVVLNWSGAASALMGATRIAAPDHETARRLDQILNLKAPDCVIRLIESDVCHAA